MQISQIFKKLHIYVASDLPSSNYVSDSSGIGFSDCQHWST